MLNFLCLYKMYQGDSNTALQNLLTLIHNGSASLRGRELAIHLHGVLGQQRDAAFIAANYDFIP